MGTLAAPPMIAMIFDLLHVSDNYTNSSSDNLLSQKSPTKIMSLTVPSPDDVDDIFLSCRYGDVEDIQQFVDRFGQDLLNEIRDDNGNTVLHMACANGHAGTCKFSLAIFSHKYFSIKLILAR